MKFVYPVDVTDLVRHAKLRGVEFVRRAGLRDDMRDDEKLRAITDSVSCAWFPLTLDRRAHDEVDIGLPKLKEGDADQEYCGTPVFAVADGEVLYAQSGVASLENFEQGRVILRHQTPQGGTFFVQYRHVAMIQVGRQSSIAAGTKIGYVGWHGRFPHVGVSAASLQRIGDEDQLGPSCRSTAIPVGRGAWGVHCIEVDSLDKDDWPIEELRGRRGYLYDPIELIRFCLGEPYRHFIGAGSPDSLVYVSRPARFPLVASEPQELRVLAVLAHPAMRDSETLRALALDPGFAPLDRNANLDKAAVMALQDALLACKLSPGRTGPDPDKPGVDGVWGNHTDSALVDFQKTRLKELVETARPPALLANMSSKLRIDGKVDWLTLIGLDAAAGALHSTPDPIPKQAPAAPAPNPPVPTPPAATPGASPEYSNTFDASKPGAENLSMHFGIRMYKAMLKWVWGGTWDAAEAEKEKDATTHAKQYHGTRVGVGYSSCNAGKHYPDKSATAATQEQLLKVGARIIDGRYQHEWPDIGFQSLRKKENGADATTSLDGTSWPVYHAWGTDWVGTNYTNCCNSQLAALACALADGKDGAKFSVVGGTEFCTPRGTQNSPTTSTYYVNGDSQMIACKKQGQGNVVQVSTMKLLLTMFNNWGEQFYFKKPGGTEYDQNMMDGNLAVLSAIKRFSLGEALFSRSDADQTDTNYRTMLIGDPGATRGHAWMVGDVRYGIWVVNGSKSLIQTPDYAVDQSSFVPENGEGTGGADGHVFKSTPSSNAWYTAATMEGRGPNGRKTEDLKPPLNEKECCWLLEATNETEFKDRIARFLATEPAAATASTPAREAGKITFGGKEYTVKKIKVIGFRVFSANLGLSSLPGNTASRLNVARAIHYKWTTNTGATSHRWDRNDALTDKNFKKCGITCAWHGMPNASDQEHYEGQKIAIARYYKPRP